MSSLDAYLVLDLPRTCADAEIERAFRKASLLVHPDRYPNDPLAKERFQMLHDAKELLMDPQARHLLDVELDSRQPKAAGGRRSRSNTGGAGRGQNHASAASVQAQAQAYKELVQQKQAQRRASERARVVHNVNALVSSPYAVGRVAPVRTASRPRAINKSRAPI
mmetsp:Transcript_41266/g.108310  ORF Transcript_41266/g.108310 Transcript_41266/m.108310 type:complete len:165 (-) Transcript_41266:120-614(-)